MSSENTSATVESPCVRNCCLDDNNICLGCYRSLEEITGWSNANGEQRKQILLRAEQRKQAKQRQ